MKKNEEENRVGEGIEMKLWGWGRNRCERNQEMMRKGVEEAEGWVSGVFEERKMGWDQGKVGKKSRNHLKKMKKLSEIEGLFAFGPIVWI